MKSVITEGTSIAKAVEEGLKKAGMPQEFFIKILQEPLSGFLGFGSRKAKVALFFKREERSSHRISDLLSQDMYKDLFNNKNLQRQIDQQEKSNKPKVQQQSKEQPKERAKKPYEHRPHTPKHHPRRTPSTSQQSASTHEKKEQRSNTGEQRKVGIRKLQGDRRQNRWRNKHNAVAKKPNSNNEQ